MKRLMLSLIIGLPATSVVLGGVLLYFALNTTDVDVLEDRTPMSKTSWRAPGDPDVDPIQREAPETEASSELLETQTQ